MTTTEPNVSFLNSPEFAPFASSHTSGAAAAREVARHQAFTAQPVIGEAVVQTIAEDGTPMIGGEFPDPVVEFKAEGARPYELCLEYARGRMQARAIGSRAHYRVVTLYAGPTGPVFTL